MEHTNPPSETVSVAQHIDRQLRQLRRTIASRNDASAVDTTDADALRIDDVLSHDCRKYNAQIYTSHSNTARTLAALDGRANSLPGSLARPGAAGYAHSQHMTEYATSRGYTTPEYQSTVSRDSEPTARPAGRVTPDGGALRPVDSTHCGAPDAIEGVCRQPPTHEVEINAPKRGHDISRRCQACAERARGRPYVRDVRPITLDTNVESAAAAVYDHYRYTRATHAKIGYTPAVRVVPDEERLHVSRGGILYLDERTRDNGWRGAHVLLEDPPGYFEVTRPSWADTSDWLDAASSCVRETITDADGREWSLPTDEIATTLQDASFLEEGDSR